MAEDCKTVQGLAIASVKTLQGLAIASVQTINGVDNTAGGPTLVAEDNFQAYAASAALDAQTDWVGELNDMTVFDNAGAKSVYPSSNGSLLRYAASFSANQRTEVTVAAVAGGSATFDWIGPAVRIQTGAATGYLVVYGQGDIYLLSCNAGTFATINSDTGGGLVAGNRIAIEANGSGASTRLRVQVDTGGGWVDKWTDQNPAVDIDGGSCGVGSWALSGLNNKLDDFKGYDL